MHAEIRELALNNTEYQLEQGVAAKHGKIDKITSSPCVQNFSWPMWRRVHLMLRCAVSVNERCVVVTTLSCAIVQFSLCDSPSSYVPDTVSLCPPDVPFLEYAVFFFFFFFFVVLVVRGVTVVRRCAWPLRSLHHTLTERK